MAILRAKDGAVFILSALSQAVRTSSELTCFHNAQPLPVIFTGRGERRGLGSVFGRLRVQAEDALQLLDRLRVLAGDYVLGRHDALGDRSVKM